MNKRTEKRKNTRKLPFFLLFINFFVLQFFSIVSPALAQTQPQEVVEVSPFCFRQAECQTYNASPSPYPDPVCSNPSPGHNQRAVDLEYKYNCYSNPPTTKLQVSIGGFEVKGIEQYVRRLYVYLVSIAGIVAGIMMVWAGTKWLTSGGSSERITDAKHKIGNAAVGIVLVLASYLILQIVNPALVELKLPPVKIVRRDLGETQEWCVKRTEFPCGGIHLKQEGGAWIPDPTKPADPDGQWDCSDPAYLQASPSNPPCGVPKGGTCYGQYCAEGGCQRIVPDRMIGVVSLGQSRATSAINELGPIQAILRRGSRQCFASSRCNNCNIPLHPTGNPFEYDYSAIALCASTACNCIVVSNNLTPTCIRRRLTGQHCDSDQECESNNCNHAFNNTCGPSPLTSPCDNDEDCRSGLCNKNVAPNQCVARGGIPNGQDCSRSIECRSGICGYSGLISNITPGIDPVCLQSGAGCEYNPVGCNAD